MKQPNTPATKKLTTPDLVLTALFATLTFIGTSIRIPVPAGVGAPFIHLGNSILLLAVLLIGYRKGALAGAIGFVIFDLLNGYAAEAPYFIFESFIVGGVAILTFQAFKKKDDQPYKIAIVAVITGLAKITMAFLKNIVVSLVAGASLRPAVIASLLSLPATFVNCVSTVLIVTMIYYPLKKIVAAYYRSSL